MNVYNEEVSILGSSAMSTKMRATIEDLYRVESQGMEQSNWDIRREGRRWTREEFDRRIYQAPEKIEFVGGIFASERERLTVLAMLLENLGIDKAVRFGELADWKAAIADFERQQSATSDS